MRYLLSAIIFTILFSVNHIECKEDYHIFDAEIFYPPFEKETVDEPEEVDVVEEIIAEIDQEEGELLAQLIFAEAGSDWCEDNMLYYTGSVVLNRIKSEHFPNTMQEVIYQPGQYSCVNNGMIDYEYNQRAYNVAEDLLTSGSCLPDNVVFQAQFEQGDGTYVKVQNMYFCYKGEAE